MTTGALLDFQVPLKCQVKKKEFLISKPIMYLDLKHSYQPN